MVLIHFRALLRELDTVQEHLCDECEMRLTFLKKDALASSSFRPQPTTSVFDGKTVFDISRLRFGVMMLARR